MDARSPVWSWSLLRGAADWLCVPVCRRRTGERTPAAAAEEDAGGDGIEICGGGQTHTVSSGLAQSGDCVSW